MPHRGPLSFIGSDVADRPEDVGATGGMLVNRNGTRKPQPVYGPACQAASERPSPQWISPSGATNF